MCGVYKTIAPTHLDLITTLITSSSELNTHVLKPSKGLSLLVQVPLAERLQADLSEINLV